MQPTFSVGMVTSLVGRNTVSNCSGCVEVASASDLWLNAHHCPDVHPCLVQPGLLMDVVDDFHLDLYNAVMYLSVLVDVIKYGQCLSLETPVY